MRPLRAFIRTTFGVRHEDEIDTTRGMRPAYETMKEESMRLKVEWDEPISADPMHWLPQIKTIGECHLTKQPPQFAVMTALRGVHVDSTYPVPVEFRSNVMLNLTETERTALEQQERMQKATGGTPGAVFHLQGQQSQDADIPFLAQRGYGYTSPQFVMTMGNIGMENLFNGIVHIPRSVLAQCDQEKLAIYHPEDPDMPYLEESRTMLMHWVFIPTNHILAWPIRGTTVEFRHLQKMNVREYRVQPRSGGEPFILAYLVGSNTFHRLVDNFMHTFAGKLTVQHMPELSFEMIPNPRIGDVLAPPGTIQERNNAPGWKGRVEMRVHMSYFVSLPLQQHEKTALFPALSPHFISYAEQVMQASPDFAAALQQQQQKRE